VEEPHGTAVGVLINLGVPFIGIAAFLELRGRIASDVPLQVAFFFVFAHYGAFLVLVLTGIFWYMSGMAALGAMYLPTVGVVVMLVTAFLLGPIRSRSKYHLSAFWLAAVYPLLMASVVLCGWVYIRSLHP
jgi:hypothetical protein